MNWREGLGKDNRGSRPRCVLLTSGKSDEVAERLTQIIDFPGVVVSPNDKWMPYGKPVYENGSWNKASSKEAELDKEETLLFPGTRIELQEWWLAVRGRGRGARTPTWDITGTCKIEGRRGIFLVEAKAHENELSDSGKSRPGTSRNSQRNHEKIGQAISDANAELKKLTGNPWNLCRDKHYQLSNRFAWSWKLALLGIPVVLVYLGFLNATDMRDDGELFLSGADWESALKNHGIGCVDNFCWGKSLDCNGTPLIPLIRVFDQPFDPCA